VDEAKAKGVGGRAEPMLSALVVARNEEKQLPACLETLRFADEIVVVLDRTTDRSAEIARMFGARVVEGAWPFAGERRTAAAFIWAITDLFAADASIASFFGSRKLRP